jgi:hypothetical protein
MSFMQQYSCKKAEQRTKEQTRFIAKDESLDSLPTDTANSFAAEAKVPLFSAATPEMLCKIQSRHTAEGQQIRKSKFLRNPLDYYRGDS